MKRQRRSGFTLVELLIVVVIIGILVALIVPAVANARYSARIAQAKTEIQQIETALVSFKTKFGIDPPSKFVLCEQPSDWNLAANAQHKAVFRRMFPQFDFAVTRDLNLDGDTTDAYQMDGAECLVFFLGGMTDNNGALIGFSPNPSNPLSISGSGTRVGPFFEFDYARIQDRDNDGAKEYSDTFNTQGHPIVYYSSYEGSGYKTDDLSYGMTDFYRHQVTSGTGQAYKHQSWQIIAPGLDGILGNGGTFESETAPASLANGRPTPISDPTSLNHAGRAEYDNLTNFHGGILNR